MTKLMEWLLGGALCLCIWLSLVTNIFGLYIIQEWMQLILVLPFVAIGIFGMYAVSTVLWRVYTFNDCEGAAKELQEQIIQAKEDLTKKGFVFEKVDKKHD